MKISTKKASPRNTTRWKHSPIKSCAAGMSGNGFDRLEIAGPDAVTIYVTHADADVTAGGYPTTTALSFDLADVAEAECCVRALNQLIVRARRELAPSAVARCPVCQDGAAAPTQPSPIDVMLTVVADVADVRWDRDREIGIIVGIAPDSAGADTSPGSAWDEETDRLIADVRAVLPAGWSAEWSDDDIHITSLK